jgi:hypothetical protein
MFKIWSRKGISCAVMIYKTMPPAQAGGSQLKARRQRALGFHCKVSGDSHQQTGSGSVANYLKMYFVYTSGGGEQPGHSILQLIGNVKAGLADPTGLVHLRSLAGETGKIVVADAEIDHRAKIHFFPIASTGWHFFHDSPEIV